MTDWLEPLPDAELMRATDAWAIEQQGVPGLELMDRAGLGLARLVESVAPSGRVVVVAGKGNNGGDGYVAARALREAGRDVVVLALPGELRGDARASAERLPGAAAAPFTATGLEGAAVIVDCVLGTGFEGAPHGDAAQAIEALAAVTVPVVAADVPSGVNASTGEVEGAAVSAVATATFHAAKPGLWIQPGKHHAGEVHVVEIGIPRGAPSGAQAGLIGDAVLADIPRRDHESTKFSAGNVVVVGGSPGLTGAPALAALAAMRSGAGYVTIAGPAEIEAAIDKPLEAMFRGLPAGSAALAAGLEALERADAAVLGPGLGKSEAAFGFARELAVAAPVPLVIDADGLNALAAAEPATVLADRRQPTVLTPHGGELARLLGATSDEVRAHRLDCVRRCAASTGAIVVLKGDDTIVARPDGRVAVSRGGAPALATAGTGDVLAGVIAALLAKGLEPFHAACAGVHAHLLAGQRAAEPHGPEGVIASDVAACLPPVLNR